MSNSPDAWHDSDDAKRLSDGRDTGFFEVMKSLPISIVSIDTNGVITHVFGKNPEMIGLDEMMVGQSIFDVPDISMRVLEAFSQAMHGQEIGFSVQHNARDFSLELRPRTCDNGSKNGVVVVIFEIMKGEKKDTVKLNKENTSSVEQQAIVGLLIRSISHDIQNLLMTVSGYFELAKMSKDPAEKTEAIDTCGKGIMKTIEFARQLSQLVCQAPSEFRILNINDILKDPIIALLSSHAMSKGITLTCKAEDNLDAVVANTVYIERIIMNLVINAIEASSKGDKIDMKVFNTSHAPHDTEMMNQEDMSKCVCIEVKDYGQGIPKEYIPRIFECGFSLKKQEAGRGVGLSGVADMVKKLNGHILVESEKNEGTTFRVYIPTN